MTTSPTRDVTDEMANKDTHLPAHPYISKLENKTKQN